MLYKLPDGRSVVTDYQDCPVLGFMVKRLIDGLYWDEDAFRSYRWREYWVPKRGTLHEFEYAKWLMTQSGSPCELEIVVDRDGLVKKSGG